MFQEPMVTLPSGRYLGAVNDRGTMTFQNIPYGNFQGRWKPLGPVTQGTELHTATTPGPACPQVDFGPYPKWKDQVPFDEAACFNLSVSTTDCDGKKPVLVYIHGGANIAGGYFDPKIQTAGFVDRHPGLVAVAFNYRLGVLGTLCLDGLTREPDYRYSGNLSTLDQLQALIWVHENIAAFGGDPENVTIAGQSSGCASVKQLFFVRESWPLWHRAICQSGTTLSQSRPISREDAVLACQRLCQALGAKTLDDLLGMDTAQLLSVFPLGLGLCAVEDDITLPEHMNVLLCGGDETALVQGKEILLGCMNGDMDSFAQDLQSLENTRQNVAKDIPGMLGAMDQELAELYAAQIMPEAGDARSTGAYLRSFSSEDSDRLITAYQKQNPEQDGFFLLSDCMNDFQMFNPLTLESAGLCKRNKVYLYVWTWAPKAIYPLRGYHAMEVPIVFNATHQIEGDLTETDLDELDRMYQVAGEIWERFITTGEPITGAVPFDRARVPTLLIDLEPKTVLNPRRISGECLTALYRQRSQD